MLARRAGVKHKGETMAQATTLDGMLDGRILIAQPAKGYRAGLDAALLAAAVPAAASSILEAGCGAGAALIAAAARSPRAHLVGIEREEQMAELARSNVERNAMASRVAVITADIAAGFSALGLEAFEAAIANPPFFDDEARLRPPGREKRAAFIDEEGLAAWARLLCAAVGDGGSIILIHRADALLEILRALEPRAGSFQVRPIQPFAGAPAKRIVVRAAKGGRAPLRLLAPLLLHSRGGEGHTSEAEAILRGRARLEWAEGS